MGNRAVALNADGTVTLRKGRLYRLLIVANGEPGEIEARAAVLSWGLDGADTAISWPGDWKEDAPRDWPEEPDHALAANEFPLRVSGSMTGPTRTIGRDSPVAGGGTLTIEGAWDYGAASDEARQAAQKEDAIAAREETEDEKKGRTRALMVAAGIFGVGLLVKFAGSREGIKKEAKEYDKLAARADSARRAARIRELMEGGHDEDGAEAIAHHEEWTAARAYEHSLRHPDELEHQGRGREER